MEDQEMKTNIEELETTDAAITTDATTIISQAITEHLPLISSDLKFPFYREQGLELIEC